MRTRRTVPSTVPEARVELIIVGATVEVVAIAVAVFICTKLTFARGRSLQTLLGTSIGVTNLKRKLLRSNRLAVEIPNDSIADFAGFKAAGTLVDC